MNILFIGDIFGRPARNATKKAIKDLKQEYNIDFIIANGENLASGLGMTYKTYSEMIDAGIDYFTSGNHIWSKKDFVEYLSDEDIKVLRPANYPKACPGRGVATVTVDKQKITIINLLGQAFMRDALNNSFEIVDDILKDVKSKIIIIDFHAEATSEKNCLSQYLDGRISAFLGTHTHVQTNDARILPKGTGYITDVGMVGVENSSIGLDSKTATKSFLTGMPFKMEVAEGNVTFSAALLEIDDKTGKTTKIKTIKKQY